MMNLPLMDLEIYFSYFLSNFNSFCFFFLFSYFLSFTKNEKVENI